MSYNKTIFFIPTSIEDYKSFTTKIGNDNRWNKTANEKLGLSYLLPYVTNVSKDEGLFQSFSYNTPETLDLYMYEKDDF